MNKELLEEINKGNISRVALFTQDESPILYTEKYVKEKDKEIERLNNIIKEAIEYIEKHQCCDGKINVMTLTEYKELLDILKGSEKE